MITVVNKYTHRQTSGDINIMRPSPLGNPFSHKSGTLAKHTVPSRQEAVTAYRNHLIQKIQSRDIPVLRALAEIKRKHEAGQVYLVCCCKPLACHGDVIKEVIESNLYQFNV